MIRCVVLVLVSAIAAAVWIDVYAQAAQTSELTVSYLDVGQGDATLIESPDGRQVLIDGGRDASVLRELGTALGFWDRYIDVVIATHPDADHVGGLADVLERYDVGIIVLTENQSDSPAATRFMAAVAREGTEVVYARKGQKFEIDEAQLRVLFPDREVSGLESNASSIVLQLQYGETQFLFTGDAPKSIELYLVEQYGAGLQSDVLKIGHHGSKTSTAEVFLEMVDPAYAVVSAGCDNPYGHPHAVVLETLAAVPILETCALGTITFSSDGQTVVQKK